MPQPTSSAVHIDALLTNISIAYIQQAADFVAGQVFPEIPVDKQSDKYKSYDKNDWFRDEAEKRGDATESVGSGYNLSDNTYFCDVWAFHKDVGDQTRRNADMPVIDMDRDATRFVTQRLMLRREIQWVTDFFTTSVWATDLTPGVLWSTYATSDPVTDVETGKATILKNTGFSPNTLVLGYEVYRQLRRHPDLTDQIKYTSAQTINTAMMAGIFDVDRVLVARAVKATNKEGATGAYDFTHGKHALLCYVSPTPGLLMPSAGYTFAWRGVGGDMGSTIGVKSFRMEHMAADRIEGEVAFDNKVIGSDLGYFFNGAVA